MRSSISRFLQTGRAFQILRALPPRSNGIEQHFTTFNQEAMGFRGFSQIPNIFYFSSREALLSPTVNQGATRLRDSPKFSNPYLSQKFEFKNINPKTKMMSDKPILDEPIIEEINVPILKPHGGKKIIRLHEREAPLKGFLRTHRINDQEGQDQTVFINHIRHNVAKFLSERKKPFQVKFIFTCEFQKGVSEGEMEYNYGYFHTHVERIMEDTDIGELYERMTKECLEKIEKFQNEGSGWQFSSVESFDINVDPFNPI